MKRFLQLNFDHNRIFGLDLLRMLAIILVVLNHSDSILPDFILYYVHLFYFDGVCIFFVLSGFLIGGIIIKSIEKKGFELPELINFWLRRWFRTLPNYYLFLFLLTILNKIFIKGFPVKIALPYVFFSQNLFTDIKVSFFGESWSLSVEEWFYITIALMLFLLINFLKLGVKKSVILLSLSLLIFSTVLRYQMYTGYFPNIQDYTRVVVMRMDNLMYGVIGAYISIYYKSFWLKNKLKLLVLGIILLLAWRILYNQFPDMEGFFQSNIFYPLFCTAILCTLPFLSEYTIREYSFSAKAITYISLISYSLYLIHYSLVKKLFIDHIFYSFFEGEDLFSIIIKNLFYWCASLLGALLIYKYFEIPTMKLRDKIRLKNNAPHK